MPHLQALLFAVVLSSATLETPHGALQVTLSLDKTAYKPGDQAEITVTVTNRSLKDIYVYREMEWGESSSVSIWLKDSSGRSLALGFIPDELTPPPESKADFIRLPPEHLFGHAFRVSLKDLGARAHGSYEARAQYHSPIRRDFTFGLPVWTREMGVLHSNKVTFSLVE